MDKCRRADEWTRDVRELYSRGRGIRTVVDKFLKILKGIMNAKLATNSGWKTDHSDAVSVTDLVASGDRVSLVIIPQATLAGKLKMGDKYLKYHRQVSKYRGSELYWNYISEIVKNFAHDSIISQGELQSKNKSVYGTVKSQ